jgi:hypothetical protein
MTASDYIGIAGHIGCLVLLLLARYVWRASIAPRLDELERWRTASQQADRWLASFPDIVEALDYMRGFATGATGNDIDRVRDEITSLRGDSDTLRNERDLWKRDAESRTRAVSLMLEALNEGIPLTEPVHIGKALLAQREARVVLDKGTGPIAAVHLVNIGLTGWIYTKDTAEAYAKGYNTALEQYRHTLLRELTDAMQGVIVPDFRAYTARSLLRKLLETDVGQATLYKLSQGQSTEHPDGKVWLAAKALTEGHSQ